MGRIKKNKQKLKMKQFAFALAALLSTSALADGHKPFVVKLAYESPEDLFLGLEVGNAATLKLPCAKGGRGSECTGWQLSATKNPVEFDDFDIAVIEKTWRTKTFQYYEFLAD